MNKYFTLAVAISICVFSLGCGANSREKIDFAGMDKRSINAVETSIINKSAYDDYFLADELLLKAKLEKNKNTANEIYSSAMQSIHRATIKAPDSACFAFKASQIYRGRGAVAKAKEHFARSEELIRKRLAVEPKNAALHLYYAIMCYSGDGRFGNSKYDYDVKAKLHALEVLNIYNYRNDEKKLGGKELSELAMAQLVLGEADKCEEYLKLAQQTENGSHASVIDVYKDFFNRYVRTETWLWPTSVDGAKREYLAFVADDFGLNF